MVNLADNLVFRQAEYSDLENIVAFQQEMHGEGEGAKDIFDGKSPEMQYTDYVLLENLESKEIVACAMMIPEFVYIDNVLFDCRRFELTGTKPEYRNQGMMRKLFVYGEELFLKQGGELTSVSGKPWFYSQLSGYSLSRGISGLLVSTTNLNSYAEKASRYHINDCDDSYLATASQHYHDYMAKQRCGNIHYKNKELIEFDFYPNGVKVIKDADDNYIGSIVYSPELDNGYIVIWQLTIIDNACIIEIRNTILAYFVSIQSQFSEDSRIDGIKFCLAGEHPIYDVIKSNNYCDNILMKPLITAMDGGFTGYYKILDIVSFMKKLIPVFEKRLLRSPCCYYSGEFVIGLYRKMDAIKIIFNNGKIETLDLIKQEYGDVGIPIEMLTKLLMGYIKLEKLFPDYFTEIYFQDSDSFLLLNSLMD